MTISEQGHSSVNGGRGRVGPLPLSERLQLPAGDEVEALSAATGHLDVLLEPELSRFQDGVQQARLSAGLGHILGAEAFAGIFRPVSHLSV